MECKTYATHARNRWAVGTPAKKHIPEGNTNTGARSVEWPPMIPRSTHSVLGRLRRIIAVSWVRSYANLDA